MASDHDVKQLVAGLREIASETTNPERSALYDEADALLSLSEQVEGLKHDVESAGALRLRMDAHRQSHEDTRSNFLTMQQVAAKILEDANAYKAAAADNLERALAAEHRVQKLEETMHQASAGIRDLAHQITPENIDALLVCSSNLDAVLASGDKKK